MSRRLLDLFCGEGLAAWGYWNSGRFSEIVGVDCNPLVGKRYAFDFIQADCMQLTYDFLMGFDFIHASPPCQAYSYLTENDGKERPRLIASTRHMLFAAGVPHVIENVQGGVKELRPNLTLDGHFVGLPMERRRYFFLSEGRASHQLLGQGTETISVHHRGFVKRAVLDRAFGLEMIPERQRQRLTARGIEEGIPPAMTYFIATRLYDKLVIG